MNKEQIAFEKWAEENEIAPTHNNWLAFKAGMQARAALDKQDTSEIVAEIDKIRLLLIHEPQYDECIEAADLLTKIRKHLTTK